MISIPHLRRATAVAAILALTVIAAQRVTAGTLTYVVRPHDTLSGIAATFGTTVRALMIANNLRNDGYIVVGQVLTIPDSAPAGTVPATSVACVPTAQHGAIP